MTLANYDLIKHFYNKNDQLYDIQHQIPIFPSQK